MKTTFPTVEPVGKPNYDTLYILDDARCPTCDWSAENELGWPNATLEFLRAGPMCRRCGTQLLISVHHIEENPWRPA